MAKLTLNTIGSRYGSIDALNDNFDAIEQALENTFSLDGTSPNALEADLDMNSNDILNAGEVSTDTLRINGVLVEPTTGVTAGSAFQIYEFIATAGQTTFSVSPATPYNTSIVVIVNGLQLTPTEISVSGTNVITPALTVGDEVVIRRYTSEPEGFPDASEVNFIQAGTSAVIRTSQNKMRETVSPSDFGAIGNGVTDDKSALLAAFATGKVVDGGYKSYAVTGTMQPTVFSGLINATIIQLDQAGTENCTTLYVKDKASFVIQGVKINRGSNPYVNSVYDSNPNGAINYVFGLKIEGSAVTPSTNFVLEDIEVFGDGSGNGVALWYCEEFHMRNVVVRDMRARMPSAITDDVIQGIWFSNCANGSVVSCRVQRLYAWNGSQYTNIYTRGITGGNLRFSTFSTCSAVQVEQGFDFTGTGDGTDGCRFLTLSGCYTDLSGSAGFKFANACHDIIVTGCTASRANWYGFLVSGQKAASSIPERVDFVGCQAINSGFVNGRPAHPTYKYGFYISREPEVDGYQPRSIRFIACFVKDNQVVPTTTVGFVNTVFVAEYPTTGYNKNWANQLIDCSADATMTLQEGLGPNVCVTSRTSNVSIPNATWTSVDWNEDKVDPHGLHNTASNPQNIYIKVQKWYLIHTLVTFAANGTGGRGVRLLVNGTVVSGGTAFQAPLTGNDLGVQVSLQSVFLTSGDRVSVEVYQQSGGALNIIGQESRFSVAAVDS